MTLSIRTISISLIFLCVFNLIRGQSLITDTINKKNSKGNKDGIWIQYLDSLINPVDQSKAKYYRYIRYHDGKINSSFVKGHSKENKLTYSEVRPALKEPLPLNGLYTYTESRKTINGKIKTTRKEDVYDNGYPVTFKVFSDERLFEMVDFTRLYKGIRGTYYYEFGFDKRIKQYYREGPDGWKMYSINNLTEKEKLSDK